MDESGIASRVALLRAYAGLSCRKTSSLAGLNEYHVSTLERRGGEASVGTIRSLADLFGVSIDWLVTGQGAPPPKESVLKAVARKLAS